MKCARYFKSEKKSVNYTYMYQWFFTKFNKTCKVMISNDHKLCNIKLVMKGTKILICWLFLWIAQPTSKWHCVKKELVLFINIKCFPLSTGMLWIKKKKKKKISMQHAGQLTKYIEWPWLIHLVVSRCYWYMHCYWGNILCDCPRSS